MMRILIPFVAALGLSLGISTGVVMMRAPSHAALTAVAKADSIKAASLKADSAKATGDSAKVAVVHADSLHADSTHADSTHHDSVVTPAAAAVKPVVDTTHANPAHAVPVKGTPATTATATARDVPARTAIMSATAAARSDSTEKRIAKVFAAMQARDAARILQQMDDGDVKVILGSLSAKQQAAILGQFPVQRAALLTRTALRGEGDDQ